MTIIVIVIIIIIVIVVCSIGRQAMVNVKVSREKKEANGVCVWGWRCVWGGIVDAEDAQYHKFNWRPKTVKPELMTLLGSKRVRQLRRSLGRTAEASGVDAYVYVTQAGPLAGRYWVCVVVAVVVAACRALTTCQCLCSSCNITRRRRHPAPAPPTARRSSQWASRSIAAAAAAPPPPPPPQRTPPRPRAVRCAACSRNQPWVNSTRRLCVRSRSLPT